MVKKRSSFMILLSLFIVIAALPLEASVPRKTFHYVKVKKSWSNAQQYCKEKFTDLASAGDHKEQLIEIVKNVDKSECLWIGLYRDPGNRSVWRWTGERGDAARDTNWQTGEPEMRSCTISMNKMWHNRKCSHTYRFYCSDGDSVRHETTTMSWFDAEKKCDNLSMELATVTQDNQHKFKFSGTFWIGLHIPPNTPGNHTSKDIWKWTGKDSNYRSWAKGYPDHEDCGCLDVATQAWSSVPCRSSRWFICFADNVVLVKENKTWEEALEHCRAIGSVNPSQHNHYREHRYDLVSLQSEYDHHYARDKIQEATTNEV